MKNNGMIFDEVIGCSAVFGAALQMLLNGGLINNFLNI